LIFGSAVTRSGGDEGGQAGGEVVTGHEGAGAERYRADRKDQWWKRTQWAFELLLTSDGDREVLGLMVLEQQAAAKAADEEDSAFIAEVVQPVVDAYMQTDDTEVVPPSDGAQSTTTDVEERPT